MDLKDNIRKAARPQPRLRLGHPDGGRLHRGDQEIFYQFASLYSAQLAQHKITPEKEPRPEDSLVVILFRLDCFAPNYTTP